MPRWLCRAIATLGGCAILSQAASENGLSLVALQTAAEKGDTRAQRELADAYAGSLDSTNAVAWYRKAAEQGDAQSQWQLARYYEFGAGQLAVSRDAALTWYLKAANQGYPNAQFDLGQFYEGGRAGSPDYIEAHKWYTLALKNHAVLAQANRDRLVLKMTSEQIEEGQHRADSFNVAVPEPNPQPPPGPLPADKPPTLADSRKPELSAPPSGDRGTTIPIVGGKPEAVPTLDGSVESLLSRMTQSVASPSTSASENRIKTACPEPRSAASADAGSVESLLARMAEAVSPAPAHKVSPAPPSALPLTTPVAKLAPAAALPVSIESPSADTPSEQLSEPLFTSLIETVTESPARPDSATLSPVSTDKRVLADPPVTSAAEHGEAPKESPAEVLTKMPASPALPGVTNLPVASDARVKPKVVVNSTSEAPSGVHVPEPTSAKLAVSIDPSPVPLRKQAITAPGGGSIEPSPASGPKTIAIAPSPAVSNGAATVAAPAKPTASLAATSMNAVTAMLTKAVAASRSLLQKKSPEPVAPAPAGVQSAAPARPERAPALAPPQQLAAPAPPAANNRVASPGEEPKPATPAASLNPGLLARLHLNAIAAFGKRRAASINGRSVFEGEEAAFDLDGVRLKVRCLEIKNSSVVLQVAGITGSTEITMQSPDKQAGSIQTSSR